VRRAWGVGCRVEDQPFKRLSLSPEPLYKRAL